MSEWLVEWALASAPQAVRSVPYRSRALADLRVFELGSQGARVWLDGEVVHDGVGFTEAAAGRGTSTWVARLYTQAERSACR